MYSRATLGLVECISYARLPVPSPYAAVHIVAPQPWERSYLHPRRHIVAVDISEQVFTYSRDSFLLRYAYTCLRIYLSAYLHTYPYICLSLPIHSAVHLPTLFPIKFKSLSPSLRGA